MSNAKMGTLHMRSQTQPASTLQLIPYLLHTSVGPVSPTLQVATTRKIKTKCIEDLESIYSRIN